MTSFKTSRASKKHISVYKKKPDPEQKYLVLNTIWLNLKVLDTIAEGITGAVVVSDRHYCNLEKNVLCSNYRVKVFDEFDKWCGSCSACTATTAALRKNTFCRK